MAVITGMMFVKTVVLLIPSSLMETVIRMKAREEPNRASMTRFSITLAGGFTDRVFSHSKPIMSGRK